MNFLVTNDLMKGTIYENGYGFISKKIMQDNSLSLQAKGIYAYLSSYAFGDNDKVFPKQKTMSQDLNMAEDTIRKYLNELYEKGYVKKEKYLIPKEERTSPKQRFRNHYILTTKIEEIVENIETFEPHVLGGVQKEVDLNQGVNNNKRYSNNKISLNNKKTTTTSKEEDLEKNSGSGILDIIKNYIGKKPHWKTMESINKNNYTKEQVESIINHYEDNKESMNWKVGALLDMLKTNTKYDIPEKQKNDNKAAPKIDREHTKQQDMKKEFLENLDIELDNYKTEVIGLLSNKDMNLKIMVRACKSMEEVKELVMDNSINLKLTS